MRFLRENISQNNIQRCKEQDWDVWYRHVLKPLSRRTQKLPYKTIFTRRILPPKGIPAVEVGKVHGFVLPDYLRYSPLIGMLFTYNNFIENSYRYGDPDEEYVILIRLLFHSLPGGDVQPTHLSANAAAHLTPSAVGKIFVAWENYTCHAHPAKPMLAEEVEAFKMDLRTIFDTELSMIEERTHLEEELQVSQDNYDAVIQRELATRTIKENIKVMEGRKMAAIHRLRKYEKRHASIHEQNLEKQNIRSLELEIDRMRPLTVNSDEKKKYKRLLNKAKCAFDMELQSRQRLVDGISNCFVKYGTLDANMERLSRIPVDITIAIMLSYLWQKYESVSDLSGYLDELYRMGGLSLTPDYLLNAKKGEMSTRFSGSTLVSDYKVHRRVTKWDEEDIAVASIILTSKTGLLNRPHVIPFSYVAWAAYSQFPDCGELALRNFINQIVYNPETGHFDADLLSELRDRFYPNMKNSLIGFYREHWLPQYAGDHACGDDWLRVTSKLNSDNKTSLPVKYRRERQETNIASPMSNLLRAFNALFGIEPRDRDGFSEVVLHINQLRNFHLSVDTTGIKSDGFGVVQLSDGIARYELQSFKPIHFGFVQTETLRANDSQLRKAFSVFLRLLAKVRISGSLLEHDNCYLEQFSLASLLVPYQLVRTGKVKTPILSGYSEDFIFLFADLKSKSEKNYAIQLLSKSTESTRLANRIKEYREPNILPVKKLPTRED